MRNIAEGNYITGNYKKITLTSFGKENNYLLDIF